MCTPRGIRLSGISGPLIRVKAGQPLSVGDIDGFECTALPREHQSLRGSICTLHVESARTPTGDFEIKLVADEIIRQRYERGA